MVCCNNNCETELSDEQLEKIRVKVIKDEQRWKAETLDVSQLTEEELVTLYTKIVVEINVRNFSKPVKFSADAIVWSK